MVKNPNFEIVRLADEWMAVPVGDEASSFHGVVALSEAAAFLLNLLKEPRKEEELLNILLEQYEVDRATAEADMQSAIKMFREMKLILEE